MEIYVPTIEELMRFHKIFEEREPRHSDYWLAVNGVEKGFRSSDLKKVADSIATFLLSWNRDLYRYHPEKRTTVPDDLLRLITEYRATIMTFRARSITTLNEADRTTALGLFHAFEQILGQVGTAKALNSLAPDFFPLWDNAISEEYGVRCSAPGYFLFMVITKHQVAATIFPEGLWPLKTLDEFNYCNYTKRWLDLNPQS